MTILFCFSEEQLVDSDEIIKVFNLKTSYAFEAGGSNPTRFVAAARSISNRKVFKLKTFLIGFENQ